jgi:hypothetical protein
MFDYGEPPSAATMPVALLLGLARSSTVGSPGARTRGHPDALGVCYGWWRFDGIFHSNGRVRIAEITDGPSGIVGTGERDCRYVTPSCVGVVFGAESVFNPDRG